MLVTQIMKVVDAICTESAPLSRVFDLMLQNDSNFVTVVENYAHLTPIGVITEHDICVQTVGKGRDHRFLSAANVMNCDIVKLAKDIHLEDIRDLVETRPHTRFFVLDEKGEICGTFCASDMPRRFMSSPSRSENGFRDRAVASNGLALSN